MATNNELIGGELYGSSGGLAGYANYIDNAYYLLAPDNYFTYFITNGTVTANSLWSAEWTTPPSSSSTGGMWHTSCTC
jgi:hypothetical protein